MRSRKAQIHSRSHTIPDLEFRSTDLTSFAGVVVFMALFQSLLIKQRMKACFKHLASTRYGFHVIMMFLVVHKILGFKRLRDVDSYRDDPLIKHFLGLRRFPDVGTISRHLSQSDERSFDSLMDLNKELVFERLTRERLTTLTLDLDGTVVWTTGGGMEGTAAGFNKKKKGARGYYPLLCTVAQTSQVLDMLHRPGNVHDSNGAAGFVFKIIAQCRERIPNLRLESRCDSAFFGENFLGILNEFGMEFTISVPFERFGDLKKKIQDRRRWRRLDGRWSYFEDANWQPERWGGKYNYRFIFVRQRVKVQRKGPIQLTLFDPSDEKYEYKVIVTNKRTTTRNVLLFHNGRGSQEGLFGELKSGAGFDYLPCRREIANKHFMAAGVLAHNLGRELQMSCEPRVRRLAYKRPALWPFKKLSTLRNEFLRRAGRVSRPQGRMTVVVNDNPKTKKEVTKYIEALAV